MAPSNRIEDLQPLIAEVERSIGSLKLGQLIEVGANGAVIVVMGRGQ
jgi:hypothetical protein